MTIAAPIDADVTCVVPYVIGSHAGSHVVCNDRCYYYPWRASIGIRTSHYCPQDVGFGTFSHVDDLAVRFESLANELCLDLYYNYSHNVDFRGTYSEAYQVLEVARYIHDSEHRQDRVAIQNQLGGLDGLFHHVQDHVRGWARRHRRQIRNLGIQSKMNLLESMLHHLMSDAGVKLQSDTVEQAPRPEEQAPAPLSPPTSVQS